MTKITLVALVLVGGLTSLGALAGTNETPTEKYDVTQYTDRPPISVDIEPEVGSSETVPVHIVVVNGVQKTKTWKCGEKREMANGSRVKDCEWVAE